MKKLKSFIAILFSAVFFSGCIEITTLITVNNDGSGTVEETVLLSKQIIEMMSELEKSFSEDTTNVEPFEFYNEDELKTKASDFGEEVRFISSKKIDQENKEGYLVMYEFRDINQIKINQNPNSRIKLESFEEEPDVEKEFVTFSFLKGEPNELRIQMPSAEDFSDSDKTVDTVKHDELAEADTTMMNEQIAQIFKDLKISLSLKINGEISNTNAQYVDGKKITLLEVNFGELLGNAEKMKEFREADPQNMEEVKEILKGIPGIKVDINDALYVKFK